MQGLKLHLRACHQHLSFEFVAPVKAPKPTGAPAGAANQQAQAGGKAGGQGAEAGAAAGAGGSAGGAGEGGSAEELHWVPANMSTFALECMQHLIQAGPPGKAIVVVRVPDNLYTRDGRMLVQDADQMVTPDNATVYRQVGYSVSVGRLVGWCEVKKPWKRLAGCA